MRHIFVILSLCCLPVSAFAQDKAETGPSLMERGAQMFLDGMKQELAPTLEGLSEFGENLGPSIGRFVSEMGPAFADLLDKVEDWSVYEAPEILPNGDIIIKRKPEEPPKPLGPLIYLDPYPQVEL